MEQYEFNGHWTNMDTPPSSGTRCLVTDGDLVIIATYLSQDNSSVWMFQGLSSVKDKFDVIGWMPLPRPMEKPPQVISALVEKNEVVITDKSIVGG